VFAADAGKEVDRLATEARNKTHKVDQKLEEYRQNAEKNIDQSLKKTSTELNKAVDSFDKTVGDVSSMLNLEQHTAKTLTLFSESGKDNEHNLKLVRWQQVNLSGSMTVVTKRRSE
jgi:hypothetical protein